jgi:ABC-type uncharacterized transport system permease subunit
MSPIGTKYGNRGIGSGLLGQRRPMGAGAAAILAARNEHSSAHMATLASRAMQQPETLTPAEIRSLAACVLTQAPDRN